ncbi:hypothetical protein RFI_22479 [Reticulomyxa filosa]|uniref:Uncharacterized protein n=1 Tax=Reticulomyxa filosa TaxID=46433 RepID=X6MPB4_RETFI|nr:hypothetical protein RFI_22479 [Reticulomyxa filosa]|eukprot:ETO14890.1 hypothetical protein RFI_22479 [Reticulomyxa filosa]
MFCTNEWTDDTSSVLYFNFVMNSVFVSSYYTFNTTTKTGSSSNDNNNNNGIYYNSISHTITYSTTLSTDVSEVIAIIIDNYAAATCIHIPVTVLEGKAFQNTTPSNFFNVSSPQSSIVGSLLLGSSNTTVDLNNASEVKGLLNTELYVNGTLDSTKVVQVISNLTKTSSAYTSYVNQLSSVSLTDVPVIVNFSYSVVNYALVLVNTLQPQNLDSVSQALTVLSSATQGIGSICSGSLAASNVSSAASRAASAPEHVSLANQVLNTTQKLVSSASTLLVSSSSQASLDKTTAVNGLTSIGNVLNNIACSTQGATGDNIGGGGIVANKSTTGKTFLNTAQHIGQLASIDLVIGERVEVTTPVLNVTVSRVSTSTSVTSSSSSSSNNKYSTKLSTKATTDAEGGDSETMDTYPSTACSDTVSLPDSAFSPYGNYSSKVDCAVVSSNVDPYNPGQEQVNGFTGIVVSVNVSVPLTTAAAYGGNVRVDSYAAETFPQKCNPVIIQIQNKPWANYTDTEVSYPSCVYYNTTQTQWHDYGCYVWDRNTSDNSVVCVCNHTTTFSLKKSTFKPNINYVKLNSFRVITISNLAKYPAGWILVLVAITVFAILLYVAPDVNDKPLIAHSRGVWKSFRDANWYDFRVGMEANILCSQDVWWWKIMRLWYIAIRCDHMIVGLFFRYKGTGYRRQARLFAFLAKLFTLTAANGLFYGNPTNPWGNDWIISLYASLIQMPLVFVKFCFKRYQSKEKMDKEEFNVQLRATVTFFFFMHVFVVLELLKAIELQQLEYGRITRGETTLDNGEKGEKPTTETKSEEKTDTLWNETKSGSSEAVHMQGDIEMITTGDDLNKQPVSATDDEAKVTVKTSTSLKTSKTPKTKHWNPRDFEMMNIDTLTRILETSADINNANATTSPNDNAQDTADTKFAQELIVSAEQKYLATAALRRKIMDQQYSWWHWCKYVAWAFTISWTLICAIVTLIFVIRFDMLRSAKNGYESAVISQCPNGIDITDMNTIQYDETEKSMADYVTKVSTSTLNTDNGFEFGQSVDRWLMSIFIGFLLSLFVWQPLFDLILQAIKVLRFDNNRRQIQFCVYVIKKPKAVNEIYFFANTKLLLTLAERNILAQAGADIESDNDVDSGSADENDDADSQSIKEHKEEENVKSEIKNRTSRILTVMNEVEKREFMEMLGSDMDLLQQNNP